MKSCFMMTLETACKIMELPLEQREAALLRCYKEGSAAFLGQTAKEAPEIAVDLIKAGIKAKSYVKRTPKKVQ